MKPDKHSLGAAGIIVAAGCLIAMTWIGAVREIRAERRETIARVETALDNQAVALSGQIDQQIRTLDATLRILAAAWQHDPRGFDLADWRNQTAPLSGLSRNMVMADELGVVRQSTSADVIGQTVSDTDYFRALSRPAPGSPTQPVLPGTTRPGGIQAGADQAVFIGAVNIDPAQRQWQMNVARALHNPDGSFAGVIDVAYASASIVDLFRQIDLGPEAFEAVVGLDDGKLRAALGRGPIDPNAAITGSAAFGAITHDNHGIWTGPSPTDGVDRIHAFRYLPGRMLAVIVGMHEGAALHPADVLRQQADLFAAFITLLLLGVALLLVRSLRQSHQRETALANDKGKLASANAQLEAARALVADKARQLTATLGGMTDGISMIDADLRLVEWNDRFPEIAGVPPEILRVGTPMEQILRAQLAGGQFGQVDEPEVEIERRLNHMRHGQFSVVQRQRPDGHTLELRRQRLPDGGFVTLYADVTVHKQTEAALREARAAAEAATAAKSRFVTIVSHEIRNPLNLLLQSLQMLADADLAPTQRALLAAVRQSGDALYGLVNDILELSQIEAGKMSVRGSQFDLRAMLASSMAMYQAPAAERGITLRLQVADAVPSELYTDAGRLRQVLLNLLSNAVKYSRGGDVWLQADRGPTAAESVILRVKDCGPMIDATARAGLFRPFSRLRQAHGGALPGSGLGLSICQELMTLLGGAVGCEPWTAPDGQQGNAFWLTLPASASVERQLPATVTRSNAGNRTRVPRTSILLVDDVAANRLFTATLLRREGHRVDTADSGEAAIEALRRSAYDLVFMDIFMLGMTGHQAAAAIRALPEPARSVPIIALTAEVAASGTADFGAPGMDGALAKPVSLDDLLTVLRDHVWSGHCRDVRTVEPVAPPEERLAGERPAAPGPSGYVGRTVSPGAGTAGQYVLANERISELRSNLSPNAFASLVDACLVDLRHRLPALRRALATGSLERITEQSHAMVGMAGGYGMASLEATLRFVMSAARAGETRLLGPEVIARVEADLAKADLAFRELLQDAVA